MTARRPPTPPAAAAAQGAGVTEAVSAVVERVFDTVAAVHVEALHCQADSAPGGLPALRPFAGLDDPVRALLRRPGQLAVGLGMIVAADAPQGSGSRPHLQWWQTDTGGDEPQQLDPDLRPTSLGFYDYSATEWFDVPRRTSRRHVAGPYVDVHGTGRYVLTFTAPVVVDGSFLGVVGADVPVNRFESHVLREVGPRPEPFVIVGADDRVVLSTSSQWVTGCLFRPLPDGPDVSEQIHDTHWRVHLGRIPETLVPQTVPPYVHPTLPPGREEHR